MIVAPLRKIGNSLGVILPRPLLAQVGLAGETQITVENDAIVLRPVRRSPREGWAEASRGIAEAAEAPAWPEFANEGDEALHW